MKFWCIVDPSPSQLQLLTWGLTDCRRCKKLSWEISSSPRLLLFPYLGMRNLEKFQCLGPLLPQFDSQGERPGVCAVCHSC